MYTDTHVYLYLHIYRSYRYHISIYGWFPWWMKIIGPLFQCLTSWANETSHLLLTHPPIFRTMLGCSIPTTKFSLVNWLDCGHTLRLIVYWWLLGIAGLTDPPLENLSANQHRMISLRKELAQFFLNWNRQISIPLSRLFF